MSACLSAADDGHGHRQCAAALRGTLTPHCPPPHQAAQAEAASLLKLRGSSGRMGGGASSAQRWADAAERGDVTCWLRPEDQDLAGPQRRRHLAHCAALLEGLGPRLAGLG